MRPFKVTTPVVLIVLAVATLMAMPAFLPTAEGRSPSAGMGGLFALEIPDNLPGRQPLANRPVAFVENIGQWPDDARFQVWGGASGGIWLASDAIWITVVEPASGNQGLEAGETEDRSEQAPVSRQGVHIRLRFVNANPDAAIEASGPLSTQISYFVGADEAGWRTQAPVWSTVRYVELFPGVDLELGQGAEGWSWQFTARPTAMGEPIRLAVEGAETVAVEDGLLVLSALGRQFSLPLPAAPFAYQVEADQPIEVLPALTEAVDAEHELQAESSRTPDGLLFSTFLGGVFEEVGRASAIDYAGRIVVAGWTESVNFPVTPGAFDITQNGNIDAYVARLRADGAALDYATFVGGDGVDGSQSVAVDTLGRVYLAGWSESGNFPTTSGAFDRTFNGMSDAFVLRLNEAGTALSYSSYLGGTEWDKSVAVAVDGSYRAYVAGYLFSTDYPTTAGAYDRTHNGNRDGLLTRINATGSGLDYSTYLGGLSADWIMAVVADSSGRAYVTGYTQSPSFPATGGAYDPIHNGGTDGLITRFTSSGGALEYSTFYGGSAFDAGFAIAVDSSGRAYVTGETQSAEFPTTSGAFDRTFNGQTDAYVVRLNTAGSSLSYSTYLGGNDIDRGLGIEVDDAGRAQLAGETLSANLPTSANAYDRTINGGVDAFLASLSSGGDALSYSTFIGGSGDDRGFTARVFDANTVAITGDTFSGDFPVTAGAFDPYFNGLTDAFVIRFEFVTSPTPTHTPTPTGTSTPTRTWTPTSTPTWTPTPTRTWTPTPTPTRTSTRTPAAMSPKLYLPMFLHAYVAPVPPTPIPNDPYEPNNGFSQAWGSLGSDQIYRALFYAPSDQEDFYWFDMAPAHSIEVRLWDIPAGHDYHLYLYNAPQPLGLVGYSGNLGNTPEYIQTTTLPAGRYYVRVQRVAGYSATEQYSLRTIYR